MKAKERQYKGILRESLIVILVLALLAPALAAQEKRGAQIVVTKNDGTVFQGELLAVRGTDLLIMAGSTPGGVSVSLADAKLVKVIKQGKAWTIVGGAFIGGLLGGALGYAVESGHQEFMSDIDKAAGAAVGAGIGLVSGGLVGMLISSNKKIPVVSTDPESVSQAAARLRKVARDRS